MARKSTKSAIQKTEVNLWIIYISLLLTNNCVALLSTVLAPCDFSLPLLEVLHIFHVVDISTTNQKI